MLNFGINVHPFTHSPLTTKSPALATHCDAVCVACAGLLLARCRYVFGFLEELYPDGEGRKVHRQDFRIEGVGETITHEEGLLVAVAP